MKGSDKQFIQGYNAQIAVDADSQIIVAAQVTNQAADSPHLLPMAAQAHTNTGVKPREISADAGYFSSDNVTTTAGWGVDLLTLRADAAPDQARAGAAGTDSERRDAGAANAAQAPEEERGRGLPQKRRERGAGVRANQGRQGLPAIPSPSPAKGRRGMAHRLPCA